MRSAQQSNFDTRHMVTRVSATNVFFGTEFGTGVQGKRGDGKGRPTLPLATTTNIDRPKGTEQDATKHCGTALSAFQDRCLKPLGHLSGVRLLLRARRLV